MNVWSVIRPSAKTLPPATVAQHHRAIVAHDILAAAKAASELWLHAQRHQEVHRHPQRPDDLCRLPALSEARVAERVTRDFAEAVALSHQREEIRCRHAPLRILRRHPVDPLELLALRIR